MIKKYTEFITESLGKLDAYKYIIKDAMKNVSNHKEDNEFVTYNLEDGTLYMNISGKADEGLSTCEDDITFMIFPSNFKPNLMVSLENGAHKKNTSITKYQIINDARIVDATKEFYDITKDAFRQFSTESFTNIVVTIRY